MLLVGEPGIGKTRTLEEIGDLAERRGARWLAGRCYEGEGAPPYWPWVGVLRAAAEAAGGELLADLERDGAALAELVPELRARLPAPARRPRASKASRPASASSTPRPASCAAPRAGARSS